MHRKKHNLNYSGSHKFQVTYVKSALFIVICIKVATRDQAQKILYELIRKYKQLYKIVYEIAIQKILMNRMGHFII